MDVLDAGTVVHTIALDALGHVQDTVLDATIDAQHHVRHHALAVLDAVHAEVHADLNVHLHAWEDAQNRAQIAVLRFAEDAVLHARQIVSTKLRKYMQRYMLWASFIYSKNDRLGHFWKTGGRK